MADHGHDTTDHVSPDILAQMGYETRDIALNTLVRWLFFLFAFIAVTVGATIGLYNWFVPNKVELERVSPLASTRRVPPHPQLQRSPKNDMIEYRQAEAAAVEEESRNANGTVNIPVSRAMEILANERGIAGIKGSQTAPVSNSYPGSGNYNSAVLPSDNGEPSDMTNSSGGANALHEGAARAGNTTGAGGADAQHSTGTAPHQAGPEGTHSPGGTAPGAAPATGTTLIQPTSPPGPAGAGHSPTETHGNGE